MKLLYPVNNRERVGNKEEEKEEAKYAIYSNILESILALIQALIDLSIPLEDNQLCAARLTVLDFAKNLQEKKNKHEENLQDAREIVFLGKNPDTPPSEQPPPHVMQAIESLWSSSPIQE